MKLDSALRALTPQKSMSKATFGWVSAALILTLSGCGNATPEAGAQADAPAPAAATVPAEILVPELMTQLSHYTDKVGWSVAAQNQPSASFYLDKVDQTMAQIGAVDRWEKLPFGGMAQATMASGLTALRSSVDNADWAGAQETYRAVTLLCNQCHSATRRAFIKIVPVQGTPPYGQDFSNP